VAIRFRKSRRELEESRLDKGPDPDRARELAVLVWLGLGEVVDVRVPVVVPP
jgi:hypothetical protein